MLLKQKLQNIQLFIFIYNINTFKYNINCILKQFNRNFVFLNSFLIVCIVCISLYSLPFTGFASLPESVYKQISQNHPEITGALYSFFNSNSQKIIEYKFLRLFKFQNTTSKTIPILNVIFTVKKHLKLLYLKFRNELEFNKIIPKLDYNLLYVHKLTEVSKEIE